MVHGEEGLDRARRATDVLFGGADLEGLGVDDLLDIFADVPSSTVPSADLKDGGLNVVDLAVLAGLDRSKGQVRKLIENGGLYLNNERVDDVDQMISLDDTIEELVLVLRKGKKTYHLVQVEGE